MRASFFKAREVRTVVSKEKLKDKENGVNFREVVLKIGIVISAKV